MEQDPIDPRTFKEDEIFCPSLMDILRSSVIGDNMGILAYPSPRNYPLFLPSSTTKRKSKDLPKEKAPKISRVTYTQDANPSPTRSKGYLNNTSLI